MEEKDFLLQQIEFLQFQLDDAKLREAQQKSMYESMLQSLSIESQNPKEDKTHFQIQEQKLQFDIIQHTLQQKINLLEQFTETQNKENFNLKNEILNKTNTYEVQISALICENNKKTEKILKLSQKKNELDVKILEKDEKIKRLGQDIENLNSKFSEEIFQVEKDHNEKMQELKILYQTESNLLLKKFSRLESEDFSKSACTYFTLLFDNFEKSREKLKTLQKTLEKIQSDSLTSLSSLTTLQESEILVSSNYSLKEKLEMTEKLLRLNHSTQQSLETLKFSISSLRKIVSKVSNKEKSFKDLLESKNNEIEVLRRSISMKAGDHFSKDPNQYIEEIIKKDTEISSLKRLIGQIREKDGINRPPICTPQHKRSKTLPSPFRLQIHTNTISSPPEKELEESQDATTASTDRNNEEKLEIYMKKIENLKVSLVKMKNQRDRAKNLSEKMLMELKEKKVELALVQEDFSEQKVMIGNQMKSLCGYLASLSGSPIVPKILKQDLVKVVNRYSSYL